MSFCLYATFILLIILLILLIQQIQSHSQIKSVNPGWKHHFEA